MENLYFDNNVTIDAAIAINGVALTAENVAELVSNPAKVTFK